MSSKQIINCPSCFKCFKKKGCYEKHIMYCDRELKLDKTPSNKELMEMIVNLTNKYNDVQNEVTSLKAQLYKRNKKIDVIKWLNDTSKYESKISFLDLLNEVDITFDDLNIIFEKDFINGAYEILINNINMHSKINDVLKCFNEKKNILYIYVSGKWRQITDEEFVDILKKMNVKLFEKFKLYREANSDKIFNNDGFQIEYNKNLKKIMCVSTSFESKCIRVRNKLYSEHKESLKTITEIEVV